MSKKKVEQVNTVAEKMVGLRDFRANFAGYMDKVLRQKQVIQVSNKFRPQETATVIDTRLLDLLTADYRFNSQVYLDGPTNQWVAAIDQFNADGVGDTREEAIEMALDNIEALVEDFFENLDYYLKNPKYQKQLPYYLRLNLSQSRDQMRKILNLG